MAGDGKYEMQNQLKFNLGISLAASNIAVRYHKPNPIIVERAGGVQNIPQFTVPSSNVSKTMAVPSSVRSSLTEDRMALAVRLAQRDLKKKKEGMSDLGSRSRSPSPKARTKFAKGGTKIVHTREARERAQRLEEKRATRNPLKVREKGWNSGTTTTAVRTQTPPRDKRSNLPATTNSPPTRDTDRYPISSRSVPVVDDPRKEIEKLQREMEEYLQQIQVIEQKAMREQTHDVSLPAKSRRRDGYLDDDEDPARKVLRHEEQATRAARQIYFLRQQVRALQEHVTRRGADKVKHTKKSQTMSRLAAAHRGAVRAIQSFVNQQLPDQDLRQGLPTGYHELALLIRQLALLSTQIKTDKDSGVAQEDLLRMLDRVDELNKAWCVEGAISDRDEMINGGEERRRKSPLGRHVAPSVTVVRGRQPQQRPAGKENRPKGLLKKTFNKGNKIQKSHQTRKLTPERQNVLCAGLEALVREDVSGGSRLGGSSRQPSSGMAWNITMDDSVAPEPANSSLILPKPLQHKRERAQKSVVLDVPESHFSDATLASCLKHVNSDDIPTASQREAWKPNGSTGASKSPHRSRSHDRGQKFELRQGLDRSRSRSHGLDRSRSRSPRSHRNCIIQDMDTELMQELFPQGVDGEGHRGRSVSPRSRSPRQRSLSPRSRSPGYRSVSPRHAAHRLKTRLNNMQQRAQDAEMSRDRRHELSEINIRQMLADKAIEKAELSGEILTEMILNDVLYDTASELQSLEDESFIHEEATTIQNNPTLENIYQRLEQMELETIDIRRKWGTLPMEETTAITRSKVIDVRPSGPVAMEITRHGPSQSHRVQNTRAYDKDADEPIIFTKAASVGGYHQKTTPLTTEGEEQDDFSTTIRGFNMKTKLKISESVVKEIKSNVDRYERHLRKTSHQSAGNFDPWRLVEEISDQVLDECLREIDIELEEVNENIVHQLCKSEFAIPENTPSKQEQEVIEEQLPVEDYGNYANYSNSQLTNRSRYDEAVSANQRESDRIPYLQSSIDKSEGKSAETEKTDRRRDRSLKKEVSFHEEISYEREAIYDAAELDTARDSTRGEEDEYDDDSDDESDVEEVSPIDSDELEYSTEES